MGFLDDADVSAQDAPNDPFGFGREFWPVMIESVGDPKVTQNGDRFGVMVSWKCTHPDFADLKLGYGNWLQLPVPKALQEQGIPWDKNSKEGRSVMFKLVNLLKGLGFAQDEMAGVGPKEMTGKACLAKIGVRENDEGFWQFNIYAHKPLAEGGGDGLGEFTSKGQSNGGKSPEDQLKDELSSS